MKTSDLESTSVSQILESHTDSNAPLKPFEIIVLILSVVIFVSSALGMYVLRMKSTNEIDYLELTPSVTLDISVINSASKDDFKKVSGIGDARAQEIIDYREILGGFNSVDQLLNLSFIGDATLNNIIHCLYGDSYDYCDGVIMQSDEAH